MPAGPVFCPVAWQRPGPTLPGRDQPRARRDRQDIRRFARESHVTTLLVKATSRDSKLDPFKPQDS